MRNHLNNAIKHQGQPNTVNLTNPETLQLHLETRLAQLESAINMELWQVCKLLLFCKVAQNSFQHLILMDHFTVISLYHFQDATIMVSKNYQHTSAQKKNFNSSLFCVFSNNIFFCYYYQYSSLLFLFAIVTLICELI